MGMRRGASGRGRSAGGRTGVRYEGGERGAERRGGARGRGPAVWGGMGATWRAPWGGWRGVIGRAGDECGAT